MRHNRMNFLLISTDFFLKAIISKIFCYYSFSIVCCQWSVFQLKNNKLRLPALLVEVVFNQYLFLLNKICFFFFLNSLTGKKITLKKKVNIRRNGNFVTSDNRITVTFINTVHLLRKKICCTWTFFFINNKVIYD